MKFWANLKVREQPVLISVCGAAMPVIGGMGILEG